VLEIEHQTDEQQRHIAATMLNEGGASTQVLLVVTQMAAHLEKAADALMHAALLMRTAQLGVVMVEQRRKS
jgi:precorrin-6B methylase 1